MGTRDQRHTLATLLPKKRHPGPIVQVPWWASRPLGTDAENLAPTRIRLADRPARRESLHQVRYPGPLQQTPCCRIFIRIFNKELVGHEIRTSHAKLHRIFKKFRHSEVFCITV
jgi:hypothetical protein